LPFYVYVYVCYVCVCVYVTFCVCTRFAGYVHAVVYTFPLHVYVGLRLFTGCYVRLRVYVTRLRYGYTHTFPWHVYVTRLHGYTFTFDCLPRFAVATFAFAVADAFTRTHTRLRFGWILPSVTRLDFCCLTLRSHVDLVVHHTLSHMRLRWLRCC